MLDVTLLRREPDRLAAEMRRRGLTDFDVAALASLDEERRMVRARAEELRNEQKQAGKEIARLDGEEKQAAIARTSQLAGDYRASLARADELDAAFDAAWIPLPNIAHESVTVGEGEEGNTEVERWGEAPTFAFEIRDHEDLGEALDVIDKQRGAKTSGARFAYLKGRLALLEFALVRWAMDELTGEGFVPVVPPVLVREHALFGTGFFPEAREQVYDTGEDELFLAGTAEIPLAALHSDEILDASDLPLRYAGFSTCFRREAGTYGKDTRGIFRVHQFDKVEMFSFVEPDQSWDEHEYLFSLEERLVRQLGLHYRVVNVGTGDLGAPAAKKYDIEAWLPTSGTFRELTSCSNTTDYQARRLRIRYRSEDGNRLVHTLNGTAVAIGRTLLFIMETYQQADGSITVPEVLRPYAGFDSIPAPE
jgi:seryl-tRNA synthetase